jgi:hypothetical protein
MRDGERLLFEGEVMLHPLSSNDYRDAHRGLFELRGHFGSFGEAPFDAEKMSSSVFHFVRV